MNELFTLLNIHRYKTIKYNNSQGLYIRQANKKKLRILLFETLLDMRKREA